ncbi:sugar transferase [Marivirga harenae]|uniref:sugar transferase n=1 Tax=Marivirga harenae TaxID=2010992 RepID=UPI0026DF8321|nr:sugar transferase [Marivirga harenae]WKV12909.1 sugar transferase [Marivirga harenae]
MSNNIMNANNHLLNSNENFLIETDKVFKKRLLYITNEAIGEPNLGMFANVEKVNFAFLLEEINQCSSSNAPDAIIFHTNYLDHIFFKNLSTLGFTVRSSAHHIPIIVVSNEVDTEVKKKILRVGADDCFPVDFNAEKLNYWIDFLKLFKRLTQEDNTSKNNFSNYKIGSTKRVFDILVSGSLLLLLSPLFLIIALIIKIESRGPIFYVSKRSGVGYKVFNFLKFRSMADGADKELSKLSHLNQYGQGNQKNNEVNSVFFKIKDDPRITRFGKFLRDTSLDELPQLINVVKGDMSIVGNRPLPLYEAQQLTKDQCALRFMAAAGITGLWQVTKRGKSEMSEEERISLDIEYAKSNSFKSDLKLLLKTFPALLQEERV